MLKRLKSDVREFDLSSLRKNGDVVAVFSNKIGVPVECRATLPNWLSETALRSSGLNEKISKRRNSSESVASEIVTLETRQRGASRIHQNHKERDLLQMCACF